MISFWQRSAAIIGRALPLLALAMANLGLFGWIFVVPTWTGMSPLTATCLLLLSLALYVLVTGRGRALARGLTLPVMVVAVFKFVQFAGYLPGWPELFGNGYGPGGVYPSAMSHATAACLFLLSLATVAATWDVAWRPWVVQPLVLAAALVTYFSLAGYALGINAIIHSETTFPMAFNTTVALALLCAGSLLAEHGRGLGALMGRDTTGGHLLRRMVPTLLLVPLILGWLRLQGERLELFEPWFGVAIMSTLMAVMPLAVAVWSAVALDEREAEREQAARRLRKAFEELQLADRYKDEFLSVMSHELRTPLNFITGFASFLEEEETGHLNQTQRSYLQKILYGADRMLLMVNNLLDMSRILAGEFKLSRSLTRMEPLLEEAIAPLRSAARDKQIEIQVDNRVDVEACLDGQRIIQVIGNLLDNSIKFSPESGRIEVRAFLQGDRLVTEVQDFGVGIAPEHHAHIFVHFKQLDMSATRRAGGTGLGLSISRAIVEAHGGTMALTSEPGVGSTFRLELPFAHDAC